MDGEIQEDVVNAPRRGTPEILRWALAEARRLLPHEWVLRESDDLFLSWRSEEHQELLSVAVFREGRGAVVHFTPAVVFTRVEAARVELRRAHGPGGIIEDAVPYTLHADVCPELGRLTAFAEDGAPMPDCAAVVRRVLMWCKEFETAAHVREAIDDQDRLRAWCGRDREPRDYETFAAVLTVAGEAEAAALVLDAGGLVRRAVGSTP